MTDRLLSDLYYRIMRDSNEKMSPLQATALVAKIANTTPLVVGMTVPGVLDAIAQEIQKDCATYTAQKGITNMTVIRWSATNDEDTEFENPFVGDLTYVTRGEWADCEENGESAVNDLVEDWCGETEWEENFGIDATLAYILVEVHSPQSITGRYHVELSRVVKARSSKMPEGET